MVVVAKISQYKFVSGFRKVQKPSDGFNPAWMVPLRLARISANVVLSLRGKAVGPTEFYSWVWDSGTHGGERLFRYFPDYCHVLFLRHAGSYLRTVGDYPAYDLPIPCSLLPAVVQGFQSDFEKEAGLLERIVAVLLQAELDTETAVYRNYQPSNFVDFEGLTSGYYVANRLDWFCRNLPNRFGRFAACMATGREFYGRCEAYRFAQEADTAGVETNLVSEARSRCEALEVGTIARLRANNWPDNTLAPRAPSSEDHRLAMRMYASAMDSDFRDAACAAAAVMPEARDLPECTRVMGGR